MVILYILYYIYNKFFYSCNIVYNLSVHVCHYLCMKWNFYNFYEFFICYYHVHVNGYVFRSEEVDVMRKALQLTVEGEISKKILGRSRCRMCEGGVRKGGCTLWFIQSMRLSLTSIEASLLLLSGTLQYLEL